MCYFSVNYSDELNKLQKDPNYFDSVERVIEIPAEDAAKTGPSPEVSPSLLPPPNPSHDDLTLGPKPFPSVPFVVSSASLSPSLSHHANRCFPPVSHPFVFPLSYVTPILLHFSFPLLGFNKTLLCLAHELFPQLVSLASFLLRFLSSLLPLQCQRKLPSKSSFSRHHLLLRLLPIFNHFGPDGSSLHHPSLQKNKKELERQRKIRQESGRRLYEMMTSRKGNGTSGKSNGSNDATKDGIGDGNGGDTTGAKAEEKKLTDEEVSRIEQVLSKIHELEIIFDLKYVNEDEYYFAVIRKGTLRP